MSQQFACVLSLALAVCFGYLAVQGYLETSSFWLFYGVFALVFLLDGIRRAFRTSQS